MFRGYVTMLQSLLNKPTDKLENILGFGAGTLELGYYVYQLVGEVTLADFDWKDRTTYSDGWHFDSWVGEYVQRQDELRAHLGSKLRYNEQAVDSRLALFKMEQRDRLNVRTGPKRIVKVIPKDRATEFPDSTDRSTPQWRLKVEKEFALLRTIDKGQVFAG
jgi:hypothetical protein